MKDQINIEWDDRDSNQRNGMIWHFTFSIQNDVVDIDGHDRQQKQSTVYLRNREKNKSVCHEKRVFISNRLRCIPSVSTLYAKQRFIFFLTKYWGGDNRWADRSFSDKNTSAIITHLPHTYTLKTIYVLYLRFWFLIAQIKTIPFWQIWFYDVLAVQFFEFVFDQFDRWRFTVFYTIKIDFRKRNTKMCKLQKFNNNQRLAAIIRLFFCFLFLWKIFVSVTK